MQVMPKNLKTQLFNLVERNETDELITFISRHKDYVQTMTAQNYWTLGMYAVRYGNHRLMEYLNENGLLNDHAQSPYSLLYTACLNHDLESFKLLIDKFGKDVNECLLYAQDNTLLKYATKNQQTQELTELLCTRGAYYVIENNSPKDPKPLFANNMIISNEQGIVKYKTVKTLKEIPGHLLYIQSKEKLTTVLYQRFKNILYITYLHDEKKIQQHQEKLSDLIFYDGELKELLSYCAPSYN